MPIRIDDSESIIRAIFYPAHLKNGAIKAAAFKAKEGRDDISVIRHTHMGNDFCKQKAKSLSTERATYKGLAVLTAAHIRSAPADISDSRQQFCGHADISYGFLRPPRDEPLESAANLELTERARKIAKLAKYYEDPTPSVDKWLGEALLAR